MRQLSISLSLAIHQIEGFKNFLYTANLALPIPDDLIIILSEYIYTIASEADGFKHIMAALR